jgi:hypothetical protein
MKKNRSFETVVDDDYWSLALEQSGLGRESIERSISSPSHDAALSGLDNSLDKFITLLRKKSLEYNKFLELIGQVVWRQHKPMGCDVNDLDQQEFLCRPKDRGNYDCSCKALTESLHGLFAEKDLFGLEVIGVVQPIDDEGYLLQLKSGGRLRVGERHYQYQPVATMALEGKTTEDETTLLSSGVHQPNKPFDYYRLPPESELRAFYEMKQSYACVDVQRYCVYSKTFVQNRLPEKASRRMKAPEREVQSGAVQRCGYLFEQNIRSLSTVHTPLSLFQFNEFELKQPSLSRQDSLLLQQEFITAHLLGLFAKMESGNFHYFLLSPSDIDLVSFSRDGFALIQDHLSKDSFPAAMFLNNGRHYYPDWSGEMLLYGMWCSRKEWSALFQEPDDRAVVDWLNTLGREMAAQRMIVSQPRVFQHNANYTELYETLWTSYAREQIQRWTFASATDVQLLYPEIFRRRSTPRFIWTESDPVVRIGNPWAPYKCWIAKRQTRFKPPNQSLDRQQEFFALEFNDRNVLHNYTTPLDIVIKYQQQFARMGLAPRIYDEEMTIDSRTIVIMEKTWPTSSLPALHKGKIESSQVQYASELWFNSGLWDHVVPLFAAMQSIKVSLPIICFKSFHSLVNHQGVSSHSGGQYVYVDFRAIIPGYHPELMIKGMWYAGHWCPDDDPQKQKHFSELIHLLDKQKLLNSKTEIEKWLIINTTKSINKNSPEFKQWNSNIASMSNSNAWKKRPMFRRNAK